MEIKVKKFFYILLFGVSLLGCYSTELSKDPYFKLRDKILRDLSSSSQKKEIALQGVQKLNSFLKTHKETKYKRDLYQFQLYLAFQYLLPQKVEVVKRICLDYLQHYPKDPKRGPLCLYWLGQYFYQKGRLQKSLDFFSKLVETFPHNSKAASSTLWKGILQYKLALYSQCIETCRFFYRRWPHKKEKKNIEVLEKKALLGKKWKGKEALDFWLKEWRGDRIHLRDWKGNMVILLFWKANPKEFQKLLSLKRLFHKYNGKNFRFLSIALVDTKNLSLGEGQVKKIIGAKVYPGFLSYLPYSSRMVKEYGFFYTPFLLLLDTEGKIAALDIWGKDLEFWIHKLLTQ